MDNENKFPEQEAPEKNTDKAFVQVGEDGSPVIPNVTDEKAGAKDNEKATTIDKR